MFEIHEKPSFSLKFFISFIGIVVMFYVLKELDEIFIPFVLAFFIYFVFSPINNYMVKKGVPRFLAITFDFLVLIVVGGSFYFILSNAFANFGADLPKYEIKLNQVVSQTAKSWGLKYPELVNFNIANYIKNMNLSFLAENVFTSTLAMLEYFFLIIFYLVFIATGQKDIYNAIKKRYLSKKQAEEEYMEAKELKEKEPEKPVEVVEMQKEKEAETHTIVFSLDKTFIEITSQIQKYVLVKFNLSLIKGVSEGAILWLFGVDYAVVWGVLIFLTAFIPILGTVIGVAFPAIMVLVQFGSFGYAILIAAILTVLDNILGNYIEPVFYKQKLGLSPIIMLLSLLIWGYVWGIPGMILSVPLTSIIKIAISRSESPNLKFLSDLMSGESGA